jgi:RNA polymerase sigma factor (sigma-70 family)
MKRHGPMVMGVCRQILHGHQDAEDAFQATFMKLATKAGSIRDRRLLPCWLYGVAYRTAFRLKARFARSPAPSELADSETSGEAEVAAARRELERIIQAEVARLPDRLRMLVVRCYLNGETYAEVAGRLDCPVGTIKGQLSRARQMLRTRLSCTELDPRDFGNRAS